MSMSMRVNEASADTLLINQLDSSLGQLQNLELQTTTGRQINQPSDNPAGTATAMQLNSQIGQLNTYAANATDGQSWLSAADTTLGSVSTSLQQVQTDLETGANTSVQDATTLSGLATDVQSVKQQLLTDASSSYNGNPLFSGTWGTSAYANAASGDYTYTGSSQAVTRTVGQGQQVPVTVTGPTVFGSGTSSVFALLDKISSDLTSGNASALSGNDLTQLQAAMDQVDTARGQVGASSDQLQTIQTQTTAKVTALQGSVSGIIDVDEAQAASQLQLQDVQYQAALAAVAKVIQPTLAGFLS